ncbi:hypothetical protein Tco_0702887 [Tanacetum coccineum]|uniref:Gag-pol polyprotein n=1 Tax=Tanacetum coccineum TaxID=301880 RepID=A0ABQ4XXV1_9ASTR
MLNKENYVPWSSHLLHYAKSRPNGKLIYNSIINGPYVKRMIPEPGDQNREVHVNETFHERTDDELTEKELKQVEADDQAIQAILLDLPEDIYAAVDSCEIAQEIWFTSTDGESIESYYHRFSKLMNDFKRNKHFPEKIASNLKFLNNLQPERSRHVTIVHQTKDLHTTDYTQLYDFFKYNQKNVDDLRAERLAKTHDPLALMANSNNPFNYLVAFRQLRDAFSDILVIHSLKSKQYKITFQTTRLEVVLSCLVQWYYEVTLPETYSATTHFWGCYTEGKEYPFDLSKPLPLFMNQGHQVVPVNFFINNDLEYLKGGSSTKKYTTSTKKTKATKYDIPGIEDMVPSLWSPVKVAYDRYVAWGIAVLELVLVIVSSVYS